MKLSRSGRGIHKDPIQKIEMKLCTTINEHQRLKGRDHSDHEAVSPVYSVLRLSYL